ncbi:BMP family lipoprotein [Paenibacillus beijingensis]|uniref:ABC transporter substrate-binding protein n=1 Tax=Paenibacillus beijingensis TaxID=1126833 RepID=A0A0D5NJI1_9BACL|nr:BMP family protein [Paenibacillus beijingensis]AJY75426.1 ABC transporter substrate-binding protein [Paenibacillus beijingensis]
MKKSAVLVIMLIISILAAGCSASKTKDQAGSDAETKKPLRVALITPEKIGVNPFFQIMDEGAKQAALTYKVEQKTMESADPNAIEENLRVAVADNYDLIITSSFQAADALKKVAAENPDKKFIIIDDVVDLPNVRSAVFREQEAAYLLGAAAGLSTKSDTVGMVVAMDIPLMKKWTSGFEQGLKATNPQATFLVNYVGSFTDPAKAKELALVQYSKGADFVAGASAVGDLGVFEAAKEKGFFTSGQDIDRTMIDPQHIVMSQLKSADNVVIDSIKQFVDGSFAPGVYDYGLKENGVGITYVTDNNPFITKETIEKVLQIRSDIISGKTSVVNPLK